MMCIRIGQCCCRRSSLVIRLPLALSPNLDSLILTLSNNYAFIPLTLANLLRYYSRHSVTLSTLPLAPSSLTLLLHLLPREVKHSSNIVLCRSPSGRGSFVYEVLLLPHYIRLLYQRGMVSQYPMVEKHSERWTSYYWHLFHSGEMKNLMEHYLA